MMVLDKSEGLNKKLKDRYIYLRRCEDIQVIYFLIYLKTQEILG